MSYSVSYISKVKSAAFSRVNQDLEEAYRNDDIESFIKRYNLSIEEEAVPVDIRMMKILVLGVLGGNVNDYKVRAKKNGNKYR